MWVANHILITGKVQGVGFRYFTKKVAEDLNLNGWVRNLADGRVEIVVNGPKDDLLEFQDIIKRGPVSSRVDELSCLLVELSKSYSEFIIEVNGEKEWA